MFYAIVGFDSFGLDDDGGVSALIVLAAGRYRPRHVAARQSDGRAQRRQSGNQYRKDDFDDLMFGHTINRFYLLAD